MTLDYTPTLMERLLGGQYKWWYLFLYHYKRTTNYLINMAGFRVGDMLRMGSLLILWSVRGSEDAIITYLLVGYLFESLTQTYFHSLHLPVLHHHHLRYS